MTDVFLHVPAFSLTLRLSLTSPCTQIQLLFMCLPQFLYLSSFCEWSCNSFGLSRGMQSECRGWMRRCFMNIKHEAWDPSVCVCVCESFVSGKVCAYLQTSRSHLITFVLWWDNACRRASLNSPSATVPTCSPQAWRAGVLTDLFSLAVNRNSLISALMTISKGCPLRVCWAESRAAVSLVSCAPLKLFD